MKLKIMHISPFKLGTASGLHHAVWELACAQAKLGHQVTIVRAGKMPHSQHVKLAKQKGVSLIGYPFHRWIGFWKIESYFKDLLKKYQPDIVHLQYVRVPKYFGISKFLKSKKIPYVVSLHGGMNSVEMTRNYWKKIIYWHLIEKFVHKNACALHFVTKQEMEDYYTHYGIKKKFDVIIPNIVNVPESYTWKGLIDKRRVRFVFLGRYDVWTKGLDLACEMISILRNKLGIQAELHLYGRPEIKYQDKFIKLMQRYSHIPIIDHGLIENEDQKLKTMASYDFYIQYSRFELFGMSVAEALSLGMPVILSENCNLSKELKKHNAAIVISMDPYQAACTVAMYLEKDTEEIFSIANNGRNWVKRECNSKKVAEKTIKFYSNILK